MSIAAMSWMPSSMIASGMQRDAARQPAAVADHERAQPGGDGLAVVEGDGHLGAAPVQVLDPGDEVGDPADLRLEGVVGVGDHRGVEAEARR